MKLRIACLAVALAPTLGLAAGCQHGKQAMSCAPGSSFDADAGTCVAVATT